MFIDFSQGCVAPLLKSSLTTGGTEVTGKIWRFRR